VQSPLLIYEYGNQNDLIFETFICILCTTELENNYAVFRGSLTQLCAEWEGCILSSPTWCAIMKWNFPYRISAVLYNLSRVIILNRTGTDLSRWLLKLQMLQLIGLFSTKRSCEESNLWSLLDVDIYVSVGS
jgi:hypothetical protein